jgi:lysophospholipase L1-like esterase
VRLRNLLVVTIGAILLAFFFASIMAGHRGRALASALYNDGKRLVVGDYRSLHVADLPIHFWGDSLTSGYGGSAWRDYPHMLQAIFQRRTVNLGIPKETSSDIKARFLQRPRIAGPESVVIWAGRNDSYLPDQVIANVAAMVASLNPGSKYLVLGVTTADMPNEFVGEPDHNSILKINAALKAAYGERFVPINDLLLAKANHRFEEDRLAVSRGTLPRSLRSDKLHLNDAGALEVAVAVNDAFVRLGW